MIMKNVLLNRSGPSQATKLTDERPRSMHVKLQK